MVTVLKHGRHAFTRGWCKCDTCKQDKENFDAGRQVKESQRKLRPTLYMSTDTITLEQWKRDWEQEKNDNQRNA